MPSYSRKPEIFDVVVVSARRAGAAIAMLLARRGMRVALIDQSCSMNDTLSTHAIMRAGVLQLQRWGLLDRVIAAGTPPVWLTTSPMQTRRYRLPSNLQPVWTRCTRRGRLSSTRFLRTRRPKPGPKFVWDSASRI